MDNVLLFQTFDGFQEKLGEFLELYGIEKMVFCPEEKPRNLKEKNDRICRFCGVSKSPKKFKKAAHVIPELMGNRYLISDFECDDCNHHFGTQENDLASFLGIVRTISQTKAKEGIPTFLSPDKFKAKPNVELYGTKAIQISQEGGIMINQSFDIKKGTGNFLFKANPYIPLNVFKALVKIALSVMPEYAMPLYKNGVDFILHDKFSADANGWAKLQYSSLPFNFRFKSPFAFLFKKLDKSQKIPTHIFVLHYANVVFTFPLVFNLDDVRDGVFTQQKDILLPAPFLIYDSTKKEQLDLTDKTPQVDIINLSSKEVARKQLQQLQFTIDPDYLRNSVAYDPKTGTFTKDVHPSDSVANIYLIEKSAKLKLPPIKDANID